MSFNWLDLVSSLLGLTCVFLAGRGSKYNFWVGYLYTAALFFLFWQKNLVASLMLQPVSLGINIYGHYRWTHPKEGEASADKTGELKVSVLSWPERCIVLAIVLIVAVLWGWLLQRLFPADPHPYLDRILEAQENAFPRTLFGIQRHQVLALVAYAALRYVYVVPARQRSGQSAFAGSVWTHYGVHLAGFDFKVDAPQDFFVPNSRVQVLYFEHCIHQAFRLYIFSQLTRDMMLLTRYSVLTTGIKTLPTDRWSISWVTFTTIQATQQSHFFCALRN